MTKFAVPIVVRDFEITDFGSENAIRSAIDNITSAQSIGNSRANKVFVVSAENERVAEMMVNRYCKEHHVRAMRIDRPIEAETL